MESVDLFRIRESLRASLMFTLVFAECCSVSLKIKRSEISRARDKSPPSC